MICGGVDLWAFCSFWIRDVCHVSCCPRRDFFQQFSVLHEIEDHAPVDDDSDNAVLRRVCKPSSILRESTASFAGPRCSNDQGEASVIPSFRFSLVFLCDRDTSEIRLPERVPIHVGDECAGEMS